MIKFILLISIVPSLVFAKDCDGLAIAKTLNAMTDVTRFHNCKIEVVRINSSETVGESAEPFISFLVYGKDRFRCEMGEYCPEANYEISIPKKCFSRKINFTDVEKNSNGFNLDRKKLRNHIQIKFNQDKEPIEMAFGQSELEGVTRINYVHCQINPLSGN